MGNRRALLFLLLAVVLGIAAALAAQRWLERQRPATTTGVQTQTVVVARSDVPIASALTPLQLTTVEWPARFAPQGSFSTPESLSGRVVRRAVAAGEPVLEAMLLPEGTEAGLPSVIGDEKRAVSVKVDQVIGVAGFVTPGTRVDVLVTLRRIDLPKGEPETKIVLQDVPVLAIDQRVEEAESGEPQVVNVVTLEVAPSDAEKLVFSAHEGRLQLALRNRVDVEQVTTEAVGVADVMGEKKRVARKSSAPRSVANVEVLRGSARSVNSF
jgi:pilus assembly protein CpaB